MRVKFTVIKGDDTGRIFRLEEGEATVIGRSSSADLILRDPGISRRHCRLRVEGGLCSISDMNSRNGTSAAGRRVLRETVLAEGDLIELGSTHIQVSIEKRAEGDPTPIPPEALEEPPGKVEAPPIRVNLETAAPETPSEESVMGVFEEIAGKLVARPRNSSASDAMETVEQPAVAINPAGARPSAPDPAVGSVLGGCRVEEFLGSDDVSRVYRAMQVSMYRTVALKLLAPEMTQDHKAVERFVRAARACGRLSHPNIAQVYDAGEENGTYFIAMELVNGKSVTELLAERGRNRPLDLKQALEIAEQIADALDYAHGQSVVHRGLTPDSILVTPQGLAKLDLVPRLLDQSLEESGAERPSRPGERLGRICFAAPEQLADARSATAASDIYALGAVAFLMAAGRPPFAGDTEAELFERVDKGERESLRRLRKDAPDALESVLARAMARMPEARCRNAGEFRDELRRVRMDNGLL